MTAPQRVLGKAQALDAARKAKRAAIAKGPGARGKTRHPNLVRLDWPAHPAGQVGACTVFVADELGQDGDVTAAKVLQLLEDDQQFLMDQFDLAQLPPHGLIIAPLSPGRDGSGGAYHWGCDGADIYADCSLEDEGVRTAALYAAELSEVLQAAQGKGWNCGASNGEGLSRLHAELAHPRALDDYESASWWLDSGRADFVNTNADTDVDPLANGCSVLFLWWLIQRKGQVASDITQAGGSTLAEVWSNLGLQGDAWQQFSDDVSNQWPAGKDSGVTKDDAWEDVPPGNGGNGGNCPTITIDDTIQPGTYCLCPSPCQPGGCDIPQAVCDACKECLDAGVDPDALAAFLEDALSVFGPQFINARGKETAKRRANKK